MKQVAPARRTIRLFPDYGREYPLWEDSTPTWDVGYTTAPETYGLSPQLAASLAAWQEFWETHFDPFDGWDTRESRRRWKRDGGRVARDLQEEVRAFADVHVEF